MHFKKLQVLLERHWKLIFSFNYSYDYYFPSFQHKLFPSPFNQSYIIILKIITLEKSFYPRYG